MEAGDNAWKAISHFLPGMSIRSQAIQSSTTGNTLQSSNVPYFQYITCAHSWTPHPRKLFLVEEKKYSITSRKKLSTHWLSSCAEHWKVWREINVCYTGIYTFHPDNWLKFQAWGQNWSFIKLIFMIYLVSNHNTFNCFHSQQRLGRRRAPVKNQELKKSYAVDWSYKYWTRSCKLLAPSENQCEWSYNWLP